MLKLPLHSITSLIQTRALLLIKAVPTAILGGACGLDTVDSTDALHVAESASWFVGTIAGSSLIHADSSSLVRASPPLLAWQVGGGEEGFLAGHVPVVLFGADRELEVFLGNGVPVLSDFQGGISV